MATNSLRRLRQKGHSDEDIALAQRQQEATRRAGGPMRSLGAILAGEPARPSPCAAPEDLTARQLKRRGRYGQAALLADQQALTERDPERAAEAREISARLKTLAKRPTQHEFDFFGGNVSIGHQFYDAIRDRLRASGATPAERMTAQAVLAECLRSLKWQSYGCERTATEIADLNGLHQGVVSEALALLESVGALTRIKRGRTKVITITPEGAFRGNVEKHAEVMDRYRAEVLPQRSRRPASDQPKA